MNKAEINSLMNDLNMMSIDQLQALKNPYTFGEPEFTAWVNLTSNIVQIKKSKRLIDEAYDRANRSHKILTLIRNMN